MANLGAMDAPRSRRLRVRRATPPDLRPALPRREALLRTRFRLIDTIREVSGVGGHPPGPAEPLGAVEDPLAVILDLRATYGDVVRFRNAHREAYLVSSPEGVRDVLHNTTFERTKVVSLALGDGLLASDGELWRAQRHLIGPLMRKESMPAFAAVMQQTIGDLVARWDALADTGEEVDVFADMTELSLRIVLRSLFGTDGGSSVVDVIGAVRTIVADLGVLSATVFGVPALISSARRKRFEAALQIVDAFADDLMADPGSGPTLQRLLADTPPKLTRDEIVSMLVAGHETTSVMLAWTWHLLAEAPHAEARLGAHLSEVLGGEAPTIDRLDHLDYAAAGAAREPAALPAGLVHGPQLHRGCRRVGLPHPGGLDGRAERVVDPPRPDGVARPRPVRSRAIRFRGCKEQAPVCLLPLRWRAAPVRRRSVRAGGGSAAPRSHGGTIPRPADPRTHCGHRARHHAAPAGRAEGHHRTKGAPMTTLIDRLVLDADERPHLDAMTFLDAKGAAIRSHDRAGVTTQVGRIAAALAEAGARGERVLLLLPSCGDFVMSFLACLAIDAVAVPAYPPPPNRRATRIESIGHDCSPRFAIATRAEWARLDHMLEPDSPLRAAAWLAIEDLDSSPMELRSPQEPLAYLQYTSGSTASPRGVRVTHAGLMHNHAMMRDAWEQDRDSVLVGWLPMFHDMGLIGVVLQSVFLGSHLVSMPPEAFLMRPATWLRAATSYGAHTIGGPNFAYELCTRKVEDETIADLDLGRLHVAFNGAEPVRAATIEEFSARFAPCGFRSTAFYPCYGLAEATLFVSGGKATAPIVVDTFSADALEAGEVVREDGGRVHSLVGVGHVWHDQDIAIVDPATGEDLGTDHIGEIWLSGPSMADAYLHPSSTGPFGATIPTREGTWLRTGDLGFISHGEIFITGRLKDVIIIAGRNHAAEDVEHAADSSHPAVRPGRAAAFAQTIHDREVATVVAELDRSVGADADLTEVINAIRSNVVAHHDLALHAVVLVPTDAIPKTSSGKIQRSACRDLYEQGQLQIVQEG